MTGFLSLMFFKGALLKDLDGIFERQGPNSRVGYWMCFTNGHDILIAAKSIRACVHEAVEIERAGLKVEMAIDFEYPRELIERFGADPDFQTAFNNLSPERQRGYIIHFSSAKQSETRDAALQGVDIKSLTGKDYLNGNQATPVAPFGDHTICASASQLSGIST